MDLKKILFVLVGIFLVCSLLEAAPAAPGILQNVSNTTGSITYIWQDNSNNEQGFRCYEWTWDDTLKRYIRSTNPVWSVNANITSYTEIGLSPNTQYRRVIVAWNVEGENPQAYYDSSRGHYYFLPAGGAPDYPPPNYLVAYYTSIEPPAGLDFGQKGMTQLTVRLAAPEPSNLTKFETPIKRFGYFSPNNSGFYIENIETGKNLSSTTFIIPDPPPSTYSPAPHIIDGDGWWKYNSDYDPLPQLTATTLPGALWESYLKNGTATYNSSAGTYTATHLRNYWCIEGLAPNTPYTFRAKARNGDADETGWCTPTGQVWTLPNPPNISCDKYDSRCYDAGIKFTFTNNLGFGIGTVDHYHIKWTTNPLDVPTEDDPKWSAGTWIITESRPDDWYLVVVSHNPQHEQPVAYNIDGSIVLAYRYVRRGHTYVDPGSRNTYITTYGPFKINYDIHGKVTISGGTGSYNDVVVHCGGYTTNCSSTGVFQFLHLPKGTYDVYPELPGYRIAYPVETSGHRSITLPDPSDAPDYIKTGVDFTLAYKNTYTVAGKITLVGGPSGTPSDVKNIKITCGSYDPVYPDAQGNYYIPGVFAGTYKVKAVLPVGSDYDGYAVTFPAGGQYNISLGPDATGKDFTFTWQEEFETASISGKVYLLGGTGDPTKATVYCKNLDSGVEGTASPDYSGAYQFSSIPKNNNYELWVKMDGYKTKRVRISDTVWSDTLIKITINNLEDNQTNKDFELIPIAYFSISGRVDIAEGIIRSPDTKVHCDCTSDTSITFDMHPDNDGNYIFSNVPEGTYNVYLEIPSGYKITNPASGKYNGITVGPDVSGKNFLVEPTAKYALSGKITLQGGTCKPNEAIIVCSYYNSVKKENITFTSIPDSNGNYKFINLVPANYTVSVNLPGYTIAYPTSGSYAITITNKDITGKDFYLVSYAITGRVIFMTASVEPVTNVTLICSAKSSNPDVPNVYIVAHPDAGGNYAFYNLLPSSKLAKPDGGAPVPYRIEAILEGYGVISPSTGYYDIVITNKDEQKDFYLATYEISGKLVLYSGSADLTKATVAAVKLNGDTEVETTVVSPDKNGEYRITGLKSGYYYRIRAKLENFSSLRPKEQGDTWGYRVWIPPSATGVDFTLLPSKVPSGQTCTISGKVSIPLPITPDRVLVRCGNNKTYPDAYGNYCFKNLSPGTYDISAERTGYHTIFPTTYGGHYYVTLDETSPEATGKDFTLAADPEPVYKISGTVILIGGTGNITDVTVHCNSLTTKPDVTGQYSFLNLTAGSYELWVELPKYKTKNPGGTGKQIIKLYDRDISGVDFTLEAIPTYTISGKVTITDGDVTKVKIVCSSGAEVYPDVYGRYSITDLLAGTYTVSAEMDGFIVINPKTNLYSVKIGPDAANCDFTLIRYYTISGTVKISGGTGDLGSAVVYCDSQTTKPDPSTGYYEFSKLIPGSYNVYVKLNGYTATFPGSGEYKITLGPDATLKDFTLTATTLLSVSGKVSILGGPGKMSDVTINIATLSTIPDENGNYTISGVSPGTYDLTASLSNYSVTSPPSGKYRITFNKTNLTGYNFNLATFKISGNVKLIGTGNVTDVVIKCDDGTSTRTTSPDSTGHYEFTPLPSGQYKITASLADYSTIIPAGDGSYTITLGPDAKDKNFTLMTYSISGKAVFWQTSGDITTITITLKGSSTTKTTHPDSNGNYSFATVSTGDYELSADLPGYTVVAPKDGKYSLSVKGNITEKNFTITAFSISGKVSLYNSPNPVTSVTITLKGETGTINTAPDAKGNYQFSPLPAGTYTISASLNNHTVVSPLDGSYTVTIPQNATGKDFNIVAYSISGAVKIYDAAGPAGATVYCQGDAGTIQYTVDTTGKFQFYPLPAGNYKLWVEKSGYKTTYPAEEVYQIKLDSILTKNFALQKK
jgi:hypothetical protein